MKRDRQVLEINERIEKAIKMYYTMNISFINEKECMQGNICTTIYIWLQIVGQNFEK